MKWMRGYGTKLVWNLGFSVKSSNHPIIPSTTITSSKHVPKKQTNPPRLAVTKQQDFMTKLLSALDQETQ